MRFVPIKLGGDLGVLGPLSLVDLTGAGLVVLAALALRRWKRARDWPLARLLAVAAGLIGTAFTLGIPVFGSLGEDAGYGDVWVPFLFYPGVHIQWLTQGWSLGSFPALSKAVGPRTAAYLLFMLWEGVAGGLLGVLQWWLVGWLIERGRRRWRSRSKRADGLSQTPAAR